MSNQLIDIAQLINQGRLIEAGEQLQNLQGQVDDKAEFYYQMARIAFKQDDYEQTINHLDKAIGEKEDDYRFHELLGQAYGLKAQQAGAVKSAILMGKIRKAFEKALQYNQKSIAAKEGLYMFYLFAPGFSGGDPQKAAQLLDQIQQLDEAHGAISRALGFIKEQKPEAAHEWMQTAANKGKNDSELQLRVGRFFLQQKQYDKAKQCFEQFIKLQPEDAAGYNSMGEVFLKKNAISDAVNMFNRALEANPFNAMAYYNRAEAWINLGEFKKAREDYDYITTELKSSPLAKKAKSALDGLM
ncbi:MAG: tetratricopeptide repeat protein [Caldithrix sp.]|nr:tetratricopeptide repeat protein [Caldithrix sp.]